MTFEEVLKTNELRIAVMDAKAARRDRERIEGEIRDAKRRLELVAIEQAWLDGKIKTMRAKLYPDHFTNDNCNCPTCEV